MTTYRRSTVQPAPASGTAATLAPACPISYRRRLATRPRRTAALVDWEDEGGGLAVPVVTPKLP